MIAEPNDVTDGPRLFDDFYTPSRVRDLLRLYVYLGDSRPPRDPEMDPIIKRVFGPSGWREEAAAKRADIYNALVWLEQRSMEAQYTIRAYYCVGLSLRVIQGYIEREFHRSISHETVRRWRDDGVELMSDYLCGRARRD